MNFVLSVERTAVGSATRSCFSRFFSRFVTGISPLVLAD
jgi:hypothetical protein